LSLLREALEAKVSATSLRDVARDLGMPPTSVSNFMLGREPHGKNLRRFREWYVRELAASDLSATPPAAAEAALDLLVQHVRAPSRAGAKRRLLLRLTALTEQLGIPPEKWPEWMRLANSRDQTEKAKRKTKGGTKE
jgi:hypothetical protein